MEEFYEKLSEIMELDEIKATDILEDFDEWDSLTVLSVIAMIDAQYDVNLTSADLKGIATPQALYELIGKKRGNGTNG